MNEAVAIATILGTLVACLALAWTILERAAENLRRDEVVAWATRAIAALQGVALVCRLSTSQDSHGGLPERMSDLLFETSILTEIGRLYFKNVKFGDFGNDKPEAYQGLRPRVLDHLVVAHQIACDWGSANLATRQKMTVVAEDGEREFVTLVRHEVGRERSASSGVAEGGYGVHLASLLEQVSDDDVRTRLSLQ